MRYISIMTKEALIQKTLGTLSQLPKEQVAEVADFADFILKKYENLSLTKGIEKLASKSKAYDFLKEEEDLYTVKDLKEKYK